ncbi:MAG TPA: hypothetical protein VFA07_07035 [Chthonomonadaceae bacterium]|nr:hypothetical protein [Chthonomonadaceae bacterium]
MKLFSRSIDRERWYDVEIGLRAAIAAGKSRLPSGDRPLDIFLCVVDHYEPQIGRPPREVAQERVKDWLCRYPAIADKHRDADGRPPAHSFFYPWDEYDEWELARLVELCAGGYGEIELHLHHRDDTDATLRRKLRDALQTYRAAGALSVWPEGRPAFGFIHGDWALDNSRSDGGRNYCGVNNELTVLMEEGCYADFTFPSWQKSSQPRQLNTIYYAVDDPARPKSYDRGSNAQAGVTDQKGLLLIQGVLRPFLNGFRPGIDDSDLAFWRRYSPARLDRWVRAGIHVQGRPHRIFIKLHCHGAQDDNRRALLGGDLEALFADAEARYNDGQRYRLHYVTAREMFNVVKATEAGVEDLLAARDWILKKPRG